MTTNVIRFPVERRQADAERALNPGANCLGCRFGGMTNDGVTFCSKFGEEIMFESVAEECGEWTPLD